MGGILSAVAAVFGAIGKGLDLAKSWLGMKRDDGLREQGRTEQQRDDMAASLQTARDQTAALTEAPKDVQGVADKMRRAGF